MDLNVDGASIASIVSTLVWAGLVLSVVILMRNDVSKVIDRVSKINVKGVNLDFYVKEEKIRLAQEIKDTAEREFRDKGECMRLTAFTSLVDQKVNELDGEIQKILKGGDIRSGKRANARGRVSITRPNKDIVDGYVKNVSANGIGFVSSVHMDRKEFLTISYGDEDEKHTDSYIVKRVMPLDDGNYYYGAKTVIQRAEA